MDEKNNGQQPAAQKPAQPKINFPKANARSRAKHGYYGEYVGMCREKIPGLTLEQMVKHEQEDMDPVSPAYVDTVNFLFRKYEKENPGVKIGRLKKLDPATVEKRKKLVQQYRAAVTRFDWYRGNGSGLPSDHSSRYGHTDLMDPFKPMRFNQEISDALRNPAKFGSREILVKAHREMLKKIEQLRPEELLLSIKTDQDMVDHYEEIRFLGSMVMQNENIRANFKSWGISDPECDRLLARWGNLLGEVNGIYAKMECFTFSEYSQLDFNDVSEREKLKFYQHGAQVLRDAGGQKLPEGLPEVEEGGAIVRYLSVFAEKADHGMVNSFDGLNELADELGIAPENFVFDDPKNPGKHIPLFNQSKSPRPEVHKIIAEITRTGKLVAFDKNDPTNRIELTPDKLEFSKALMVENVFSRPPLPKPAENAPKAEKDRYERVQNILKDPELIKLRKLWAPEMLLREKRMKQRLADVNIKVEDVQAQAAAAGMGFCEFAHNMLLTRQIEDKAKKRIEENLMAMGREYERFVDASNFVEADATLCDVYGATRTERLTWKESYLVSSSESAKLVEQNIPLDGMKLDGAEMSNELFAGMSMLLVHSDAQFAQRGAAPGKQPLPETVGTVDLIPDSGNFGAYPQRSSIPFILGDVNNARQALAAVLRGGEMTPELAQQLAQGLTRLSKQAIGWNVDERATGTMMDFLGQTYKRLESIPGVSEKLAAAGLTEETRRELAVIGKLGDLARKRSVAELALLSPEGLTASEKAEYQKDILRAGIVKEFLRQAQEIRKDIINKQVKRSPETDKTRFRQKLAEIAPQPATSFPEMIAGYALGDNEMETRIETRVAYGLADFNSGNYTWPTDIVRVMQPDFFKKCVELEAHENPERSLGVSEQEQRGIDLAYRQSWARAHSDNAHYAADYLVTMTAPLRPQSLGNGMFRLSADDAAWVLAERIVRHKLEKLDREDDSEIAFFLPFEKNPEDFKQFCNLLHTFCMEQEICKKGDYRPAELEFDDTELLDSMAARFTEEGAQYREKEADYRKQKSDRDRQMTKDENARRETLSPQELCIEEITDNETVQERFWANCINIYGSEVDRREITNRELATMQRHCVSPESEYASELSQRRIVSVAVLAMMQVDNGHLLATYDSEGTKELRDVLGAADQEDLRRIAQFEAYGHVVRDVADVRPNTEAVLGTEIVKARELTKNAVTAYEGGNPTPLAKLIADNAGTYARLTNINVDRDEISNTMAVQLQISAQLCAMLEADEELRAEAMGQGLTERDLQTLRAQKTVSELYEKSAEARKKLAAMDAETMDLLSDGEMKGLLADCLMEQSVLRMMQSMVALRDKEAQRIADRLKKTVQDSRPGKTITEYETAQLERYALNIAEQSFELPEAYADLSDPETVRKMRSSIMDGAEMELFINDTVQLDKLKDELLGIDGQKTLTTQMTEHTVGRSVSSELDERRKKLDGLARQRMLDQRDMADIHASEVKEFQDSEEEREQFSKSTTKGRKNVKQVYQNMLHDYGQRANIPVPEGFSEEEIALLNILTPLTLDTTEKIMTDDHAYDGKKGEFLFQNDHDSWYGGFVVGSTTLTEDIVNRRSGTTEVFMKGISLPARLKLRDAMQAYSQGDMEPLGRIIGGYVGYLVNSMINAGNGKLESRQALAMDICKGFYQMLRKHPELESAARQYGLTDTVMQSLELMNRFSDSFTARMNAEKQALGDRPPEGEALLNCVTDLALGRLTEKLYFEQRERVSDLGTAYTTAETERLKLEEWKTSEEQVLKANLFSAVTTSEGHRAEVMLEPSENMRRMLDPQLQQKLTEKLQNSRKIREILKYNNLRDLMTGKPIKAGPGKKPFKEQSFMAVLEQYSLEVIKECKAPEPDDAAKKLEEAAVRLGVTQEALTEEAKTAGVSVSSLIDRKTLEQLDHARQEKRKEQVRIARDHGMELKEAMAKATEGGRTLDQHYALYISETQRRMGVTAEQYETMAQEQKLSPIDLSKKLDDYFAAGAAALRAGVSRSVTELAADSAPDSNLRMLLDAVEPLHDLVMEAIEIGTEDSPVMQQLKQDSNLSLDMLALYGRIRQSPALADTLRQQKNGAADMIMSIHREQGMVDGRKNLTLGKLRSIVASGQFNMLARLGNVEELSLRAFREKAGGQLPQPLPQAAPQPAQPQPAPQPQPAAPKKPEFPDAYMNNRGRSSLSGYEMYLIASQEAIPGLTLEQMIEHEKNDFRKVDPDISGTVNKLFEHIEEQYSGVSFGRLKKPDQATMEKRRQTAQRYREAYTRFYWPRGNGRLPKDGSSRYGHTDLMDAPMPGDSEPLRAQKMRENLEISDALINPLIFGNQDKLVWYHRRMLNKIPAMHPEEILLSIKSEGDMVDRFNELRFLQSMVTQTENIQNDLKARGVFDPECEKIMREWQGTISLAEGMYTSLPALGMDAAPALDFSGMTDREKLAYFVYGSEVDIAIENGFARALEGLPRITSDDAAHKTIDTYKSGLTFEMNSMLRTIPDMMKNMGVPAENIVFGNSRKPKQAEQFSNIEAMAFAKAILENGSIEIFDKTDPRKKIRLTPEKLNVSKAMMVENIFSRPPLPVPAQNAPQAERERYERVQKILNDPELIKLREQWKPEMELRRKGLEQQITAAGLNIGEVRAHAELEGLGFMQYAHRLLVEREVNQMQTQRVAEERSKNQAAMPGEAKKRYGAINFNAAHSTLNYIYGAQRTERRAWQDAGLIDKAQSDKLVSQNIALDGVKLDGETMTNELFAGLSVLLAHSDEVFALRGVDADGKPLPETSMTTDLVPDAGSFGHIPDKSSLPFLLDGADNARQALAAALKGGELTPELAAGLAQGLNRLSRQAVTWDPQNRAACAMMAYLDQTYRSLTNIPGAMKKLEDAGLMPETQRNLQAIGIISELVSKRSMAESELLEPEGLNAGQIESYKKDILRAGVVTELLRQSNEQRKALLDKTMKNATRKQQATIRKELEDLPKSFSSLFLDYADGNPAATELIEKRVTAGMTDFNARHFTDPSDIVKVIQPDFFKNRVHLEPTEDPERLIGVPTADRELTDLTYRKRWSEQRSYNMHHIGDLATAKANEVRRKLPKEGGKLSPDEAAWILTEQILQHKLAALDNAENPEIAFFETFETDIGTYYMNADQIHLFCMEQNVCKQGEYSAEQITGGLIDRNALDDLAARFLTGQETYEKLRASEFQKRREMELKAASAERKRVEKLTPAQRAAYQQDRRQRTMDQFWMRCENVYGARVERTNTDHELLGVQRSCVPVDSEYELPQGISQRQATVLTALAVMMLDNGRVESTGEEALDSSFLSEEQRKRELHFAINAHILNDVGRMREGTDKKLGVTIIEARMAMKDAMAAYANKNVKPLATLIAETAGDFARFAAISESGDQINDISYAHLETVSQLCDLLDGDKKLMEAVLNEKKLKQEDVRLLQAESRMFGLLRKAEEAKWRLATEDTDAMPDDELKGLMADCLMGQACQNILKENAKRRKAVEKESFATIKKQMEDSYPDRLLDERDVQTVAGRFGSILSHWDVEYPSAFLNLSDDAAVEQMRRTMIDGQLDELFRDPVMIEELQTELVVGAKETPNSEQILGQVLDLALQEKIEKKQKKLAGIAAERAINMEDMHEVYGSKIGKFVAKPNEAERVGTAKVNNKELFQNMVHEFGEEADVPVPEGFTEGDIVALNLLAPIAVDTMYHTCVNIDKRARNAGHFERDLFDADGMYDPWYDGISTVQIALTENIAIRREYSTEVTMRGVALPSRKLLGDALNAYAKNKDVEPLAQLIGRNLGAFVNMTVHMDSGELNSTQALTQDVAKAFYSLLQKHPELEQAARQYGLTDATMQTLAVYDKLSGMVDNRVKAQQKALDNQQPEGDELWDCVGELAMDALIEESFRQETLRAGELGEQFKKEELERVRQIPLPKSMSDDPTLYKPRERSEVSVNYSMALRAQTLLEPSERFRKLADPELKQRLKETVKRSRKLREVLKNNSLKELMMGKPIKTAPGKQPIKEKTFAELLSSLGLTALKQCSIPPEHQQNPDGKLIEAVERLGISREALEKEAKKAKISVSDLIDRKTIERIDRERAERQEKLLAPAGKLGISKSRMVMDAVANNRTLEEQNKAYEASMRRAQDIGLIDREQLEEQAKRQGISPVDMAAKINDYYENTVKTFKLNTKKLAEEAKRKQLSLFEAADEKVKGYVNDFCADAGRSHKDTVKEMLILADLDHKPNTRALLEGSGQVYELLIAAVMDGREDSPIMEQLRQDNGDAPDLLDMLVASDTIMGAHKEGRVPMMERFLEKKDGITDMLKQIHQEPYMVAARKNLTVGKLHSILLAPMGTMREKLQNLKETPAFELAKKGYQRKKAAMEKAQPAKPAKQQAQNAPKKPQPPEKKAAEKELPNMGAFKL